MAGDTPPRGGVIRSRREARLPPRAVNPAARFCEAGYRHIDTAAKYGNERGVGQGIRDSGLPREQLFEAGKARAIGLSNFKPAHIENLVAEASVLPVVNQIELNPYVPRLAERKADDAHGIVTEAWGPLGQGNDLLGLPAIAAIAEHTGKTAAQVVLRWHVQQGVVAIPKSANPERIGQNIDVFDFELTEADLDAIAALDKGPAAGVDSDHSGH